jgi:uncharacterized protein (TIRG00374 family)
MTRLQKLFNSTSGKILRYVVSIGLVAGFAVSVDWSKFRTLSQTMSATPAACAVLLAVVAWLLHGPRWWLLLRAHGLALSQGWAQYVTWIGVFYNSFLLGGLGGDAARIYYVFKDVPTAQQGDGVSATVVDRLLGLLVLFAVAVAALAADLAPSTGSAPLLPLLVLIGAIAAILFALLANGKLHPVIGRLPLQLQKPAAALLDQTQNTILRLRQNPTLLILALFTSLAIWLLDFASIWLAARSVGLAIPFFKTCIAASVAYAATALPISVGGHGLREGALLMTLQGFGLLAANDDRALLLALGVWAITMICSGLGGLILLFGPARTRENGRPTLASP